MARGDHIFVKRPFYTHHGIDCGNGTVIHYTGQPGQKRNASIKRTDILEFAAGSRVIIKHYHQQDSVDITLQRASSRLGEDSYNLLFNNCEHFATWCKTGKKRSEQVIKVTEVVFQIASRRYLPLVEIKKYQSRP